MAKALDIAFERGCTEDLASRPFSRVAPRVEEPTLAELPVEAESEALGLLVDLMLEAVSEKATGEASTSSASMEEREEP